MLLVGFRIVHGIQLTGFSVSYRDTRCSFLRTIQDCTGSVTQSSRAKCIRAQSARSFETNPYGRGSLDQNACGLFQVRAEPVHRGNDLPGREIGTGVALKRHSIHDVDQPVASLLPDTYVTG